MYCIKMLACQNKKRHFQVLRSVYCQLQENSVLPSDRERMLLIVMVTNDLPVKKRDGETWLVNARRLEICN